LKGFAKKIVQESARILCLQRGTGHGLRQEFHTNSVALNGLINAHRCCGINDDITQLSSLSALSKQPVINTAY